MNLTNTKDLLLAAQNGSDFAMNKLLATYQERVLSIVRLRLGLGLRAYLDSGDILQASLLNAFKSIKDFEYRGEGSFLGWLASIVENEIRNKNRFFHQAKRDGKLVCSEILKDGLLTPSKKIDLDEDKEKLELVLLQLPEEYREIIICRNYEGNSYREISIKLNKSEDACRMLYGRALAFLTTLYIKSKNVH